MIIYVRVLTISNHSDKNYIGLITHTIKSSDDLEKLAGYCADFIFASIICEEAYLETVLVSKIGKVLGSINATMMLDESINGFCEIMSSIGFDVQRRML